MEWEDLELPMGRVPWLFPVGITQIEGLKFLDHLEDVAKAYILSMNVDKQGTTKATNYHQETSWWGSHSPRGQTWSKHFQSLWSTCLPRKIKMSSACCKNSYCSELLNKQEGWIKNSNRIKNIYILVDVQAWSKIKAESTEVQINKILIEGLLVMGRNVTLIAPESWHLNWTLQEADVHLLQIGVLSQENQHIRLFGCIGLEGERGNLRPYVTNRAGNLCDCDLLQQRNMQINIPAVSKMEHKPTHIPGKYIVRYYKSFNKHSGCANIMNNN